MRTLALGILIATFTFGAAAQISNGDLEIFGYFQPYVFQFTNTYGPPGPPTGEADYRYNVGGVGQLNLFFQKPVGNGLTAFLNFEFLNNYSSDKGWGSFNIEEAYLRWERSSALQVKFGVVIPRFNRLFEIYNRTPLLPYIIRPKLYETVNGNLINTFDILPQKALVQAQGFIPTELLDLDYAVYVNYPVNAFFSSPTNDLIPGYVAYGQSAVPYFGVGGRLGFSVGPVEAGISYSVDKENRRRFVTDVTGNEADLGDLPRRRWGTDITVRWKGFTLSAEYLGTATTIGAAAQDSLDAWHAADPYFIGKSFDKVFYYASLSYDLTDELYAFVMIDHINDKTDPFFYGTEGYGGWSVGAGYYASESVVIKAQMVRNAARYQVGELGPNDIRDFEDMFLAFGASISF